MDKNKIISKVECLISETVTEMGLELVDVEFKREGANYFLRIYIDKEGGIAIDDCTSVSRAIEPILDEADPIEPPYMLEVSSPGIDRILKKDKDFLKYAGKLVDVKLYKPVEGQKVFQGELVEKDNEIIKVMVEDQMKSFNSKDIVTTRLAITF
ncbi:ribosome maturation factor RimP [Candidatus Epulonipiscium viviparus]|uniref:ribosome maturation factor RimP n=1 Tax=Candidatus Epulonipiscium viviparus TaxID=420336 RepID=UPI002738129B|nr:ribosome maturation factor RimP [Candidatus Epulopiscium viviparus]